MVIMCLLNVEEQRAKGEGESSGYISVRKFVVF